MDWLEIPPQWRWSWISFCGPEDFKFWTAKYKDLGLCFQYLCLQMPVLAVLAVISSYYSALHVNYVVRGKIQKNSIKIRSFITLAIAIIPLIQTYIEYTETNIELTPVQILLTTTQFITWIIHFIYLLALKKRLGLSPRGPILICVLWTLNVVLSVINLHSYYLILYSNRYTYNDIVNFKCGIANIVFQALYAVTLIPSEGRDDRITRHYTGETQALLSSSNNSHVGYNRFAEDQDPLYLGVALEDCTFLSKMLFYWVNPLIKKGVERKLNNTDDLYDLPDSLNCGMISAKFQYELNVRKVEQISTSIGGGTYKISLVSALHKCFWFQFYTIGFLRFISDCSGFAGPLLLNRLVSFIENKQEDIRLGYVYAFGLFSTALIGAFCNSHFNFYMNIVGLKIRAALITTIYRKTLSAEAAKLRFFNVGEIMNYMSTDTDRIVNSCPSFHAVWSIPFQLFVTLYLLYEQVGLSFLSGVVFSVVLIVVNKFIANKIGELSTKLMSKKDERVRLITEVLRGIRTIKLYVWERYFTRIISKQRLQELKYLKGRKYLDALCVCFWATTPLSISILTFGTYVALGNKLTAATVFTSMALLNMLIAPLNAFPWVLNGLMEAWVSIKRVQRLLNLPDFNPEQYYENTIINETTNSHIVIKNGHFNYDNIDNTDESVESTSQSSNRGSFNLSGVDVCVLRGKFIGIIGKVGSGKSTLLSAILAEVSKSSGSVVVDELENGFGYVAQQTWLQRGTIRDNILFGKPYDDARYKTVLSACCLAEDIHLLPSADKTIVGESGVLLSGGQKARVALARAVYQDKSIYILDDILSAVDPNVAKHIMSHCILGLLAKKTRLMVSHSVELMAHCDYVLLLEDGAVKKQGSAGEVLGGLEGYEDFLLDGESSGMKLDGTETGKDDAEVVEDEVMIREEESETGNVRFDVYGSYWKAIGHLLGVSILISLVLMQTSRNVTDWWLSYWVTASENSTNNVTGTSVGVLWGFGDENPSNIGYYMTIYGVLVGMNSVFTLFRAFLFAYGGITAATKIHKVLLKVVLKAKVTFFDISPLGRILNRFSSDTYTIDDSLPFILNILLAQLFGLLGAVVITIYGLPWVCLILIPLIPIYHWLQYNYRLTSRELKRLSSTTLSPIYSHFNETLQGLSTIKSFRAARSFAFTNENHIESNQKVQFASSAASQWLGIRLQLIGVAMITGVGLIAVIQHQFDVANPGLIGLAISYCLSVTSLLSGVVNAFTETEREMIAVERVNQYIEQVEPEKNNVVVDPPYAWPSQGVVSFNNVVMKYRDHLAPALKGVSFETRPAEKIGVVGRTGAGKSSLLYALFRLVGLHSGTILVDNVNIAHISLDCLRSRLSVIPQDPFLFTATIRENLDPLGEYREPELWSVIGRVNLLQKIKRSGGLDSTVGGSGITFSAGQKQLICLARAILHNAKIICIDEATANVDHETDQQIQNILRTCFRKSTTITIAHRINTVIDYDRVLVMGDGQVLEFDNPNELLNNPDSYFYQLVNKTQ